MPLVGLVSPSLLNQVFYKFLEHCHNADRWFLLKYSVNVPASHLVICTLLIHLSKYSAKQF